MTNNGSVTYSVGNTMPRFTILLVLSKTSRIGDTKERFELGTSVNGPYSSLGRGRRKYGPLAPAFYQVTPRRWARGATGEC
jgi:hypothetical protein